MTISEEKKTKILELYNNGVNKKDIAKLEEVSYPTIRNVLNDNNKEQKKGELKEKNEVIEKKLSEIFNYENYTEKCVLDLIFNLKRIANETGSELGDFIESIELIFDKYHKKTENPVKLFNFLLEISENMNVITDHIDVNVLITVIDKFVNREIEMEQAEEFIADIEAKAELANNNTKELWDENQERIKSAKRKARSEIELKSDELLKNAKAELKEYREKIDKAKRESELLTTFKTQISEHIEMVEKENHDLKKALEQTEKIKQENLAFDMVFNKLRLIFPEEIKSIIAEVNIEASKS